MSSESTSEHLPQTLFDPDLPTTDRFEESLLEEGLTRSQIKEIIDPCGCTIAAKRIEPFFVEDIIDRTAEIREIYNVDIKIEFPPTIKSNIFDPSVFIEQVYSVQGLLFGQESESRQSRVDIANSLKYFARLTKKILDESQTLINLENSKKFREKLRDPEYFQVVRESRIEKLKAQRLEHYRRMLGLDILVEKEIISDEEAKKLFNEDLFSLMRQFDKPIFGFKNNESNLALGYQRYINKIDEYIGFLSSNE